VKGFEEDSLATSAENLKDILKFLFPYKSNSYAKFIVEGSEKVMNQFEIYLAGLSNTFSKGFLINNPGRAKKYIDNRKAGSKLNKKESFVADQIIFGKI
jgi:hypothetical protein